ncbi:hypothetical protein [Streptomyces cellulosae]|uniref:hypothetical protein n=1 Tax=Streptomyces cellulosae TaxID=1968 RepID=UPI0004C6E981|nr:hypothetical protein [Streptomyces cellulosae]
MAANGVADAADFFCGASGPLGGAICGFFVGVAYGLAIYTYEYLGRGFGVSGAASMAWTNGWEYGLAAAGMGLLAKAMKPLYPYLEKYGPKIAVWAEKACGKTAGHYIMEALARVEGFVYSKIKK